MAMGPVIESWSGPDWRMGTKQTSAESPACPALHMALGVGDVALTGLRLDEYRDSLHVRPAGNVMVVAALQALA